MRGSRVAPGEFEMNSSRVFVIVYISLHPGGAPRKESRLSKQMEVSEDAEIVFHSLPAGKKRKPRNAHDLMQTVQAGRGAGKKH